jgi:hypothetical protein
MAGDEHASQAEATADGRPVAVKKGCPVASRAVMAQGQFGERERAASGLNGSCGLVGEPEPSRLRIPAVTSAIFRASGHGESRAGMGTPALRI